MLVDEFPAAERALADATAIEAVRDLLKNRRRVSLFDILVFLAITFYKPKHPAHLTRRIAYRMGEEDILVGPELEFFGRIPFVAIVEMGGKAL